MKQKAQWLSHVRTRSNSGDETSMPSGSPSNLSTATSTDNPPLLSSSNNAASSATTWYSMTSRGIAPFIDRISSPTRTPAASAGDPGATATTCGNDMDQAYRPPPLA